ncbi:MAG: hypothetical protein IT320_17770 [Anaerolineae bacterium]|nr:hypothetical protein [Anaerolineae bacterium]
MIEYLIPVISRSTGVNVTNQNTEAVYAFVCDYFERYKYAPSEREIAEGCYLARRSVRQHLQILFKQGRLYRTPGKRRALSLPRD